MISNNNFSVPINKLQKEEVFNGIVVLTMSEEDAMLYNILNGCDESNDFNPLTDSEYQMIKDGIGYMKGGRFTFYDR